MQYCKKRYIHERLLLQIRHFYIILYKNVYITDDDVNRSHIFKLILIQSSMHEVYMKYC